MKETNKLELPVVDVNALTVKGGVMPSVANDLRATMKNTTLEKFDNSFFANDGSILVPLLQDKNGAIIYGRLELTITAKTEFYKKGKSASVVVPQIKI